MTTDATETFYQNLVIEAREAINNGCGDDGLNDALNTYSMYAAPWTMTVGELREAIGNATREALNW
jgi:hypothetical protein